MKSAPAATLVLSLLATFADAATFDIKFFDFTGPATNISEAALVTVGTMTINDSVIAPDAFVAFESGDITEFLVEYDDRDGLPLSFDYHSDVTSYFDESDFGALFDSNGDFARFDAPSLTFSNSTILVDDENPNPGNGFFAAYLTIFDDDDLLLGYLLEDAQSVGGVDFFAGDIVDPSAFPGFAVAYFANAWNSTGAEDITPQFSGYIEVSQSVAVVPLPPALPLLGIGALTLLGVFRRRNVRPRPSQLGPKGSDWWAV